MVNNWSRIGAGPQRFPAGDKRGYTTPLGVEEEEHGELLVPNYWCELVPALNMGPRLFVDTGEVVFKKTGPIGLTSPMAALTRGIAMTTLPCMFKSLKVRKRSFLS